MATIALQWRYGVTDGETGMSRLHCTVLPCTGSSSVVSMFQASTVVSFIGCSSGILTTLHIRVLAIFAG